jgi:guanine deaminase
MRKGFRGRLFDFGKHADIGNLEHNYRFFDDGLLITNNGLVEAAGDYHTIMKTAVRDFEIENFGNALIMPGFIDAHVHSVQTGAIASFGKELLEWLDNYVFPFERNFIDPDYAQLHTRFFVNQLLKNGTTTAMVYPSVHQVSVEALFDIATEINMRVISGNTWMDRNAPDYLMMNPQEANAVSEHLIAKYHHKARLHFAVTPRYAITSSPGALEMAASLIHKYDDLYIQTHISENHKEIDLVNHSYPNHRNYLDVYDDFGMLTHRTLLGHGIHLTDDELERISEAGTKIVHCPTSNLFLGSGLFDYRRVLNHGVRIALGSDVGAGTSFSMLQTLQDAYKVSALKGHPMHALTGFFLITLGASKALSLDDNIGNFDQGMDADFVVIDPGLNPLLNYRIEQSESIEEQLFALMILGDDRIVSATYLMGKRVMDMMG